MHLGNGHLNNNRQINRNRTPTNGNGNLMSREPGLLQKHIEDVTLRCNTVERKSQRS